MYADMMSGRVSALTRKTELYESPTILRSIYLGWRLCWRHMVARGLDDLCYPVEKVQGGVYVASSKISHITRVVTPDMT